MTPEERVSFTLLDYYQQRSSVLVLSWHPPAAKAYAGQLIRIPKKRNGRPSRQRYHLDFILLTGPFLVLQELKGTASALNADVEKMRALVSDYAVDELVQFLARRLPGYGQELSAVSKAILSVGYEQADSALPEDFLCFHVGEHSVRPRIGRNLTHSVRDFLEAEFPETVF